MVLHLVRLLKPLPQQTQIRKIFLPTTQLYVVVTYGSTYGAIKAGNDPVGANAADALIFAVKQGSAEGSNGSSLGTGSAEESFNTDELRSSSYIVKAAANTNAWLLQTRAVVWPQKPYEPVLQICYY